MFSLIVGFVLNQIGRFGSGHAVLDETAVELNHIGQKNRATGVFQMQILSIIKRLPVHRASLEARSADATPQWFGRSQPEMSVTAHELVSQRMPWQRASGIF